MEYLFTSESIISFFILVILEVVLGIDNVIFVSLVMNRLPAGDINKARKIWMITGILSRSLLLSGLGWLLSQKGKNVFSFDSIITAGGTADHVEIMIAAVVVAMIVMFLFSPAISSFVHKHPTIKMLALSFLVMIGLSLVIEGWDSEKAHDLHLKNYIYFGMAFSFGVEMLNMVMRKRNVKRRIVELNEPFLKEKEKNFSDEAK